VALLCEVASRSTANALLSLSENNPVLDSPRAIGSSTRCTLLNRILLTLASACDDESRPASYHGWKTELLLLYRTTLQRYLQ
jgi:hypothetical protein